jgi:zinc finger protein
MDSQVSETDPDVKKEVMHFPTSCYACGKDGEARMCIASIPFFKEIIIMAFTCDVCGYRNTDIKSGGGISEKATRIVFKVEKDTDLNREVYKSDTCIVAIPEVDFAMAPGTLGSIYTTVEGLLDKIVTSLRECNPFGTGDSATNVKYLEFLKKLEDLKKFDGNWSGEGNHKFTLVLDDAASNCFIHNPFLPEHDPQVSVTVYERTEEQNDELGISDMNC